MEYRRLPCRWPAAPLAAGLARAGRHVIESKVRAGGSEGERRDLRD